MRYVRLSLCMAIGLPVGAAGQSILSTAGLGVHSEPLDAIQRSLGGVGVGAGTATVLPYDPTASLDLLAPTVTFSLQPTWGSYSLESEEGSFRGTRFPILGFAYPIGIESVLTLAAGSLFDQRWAAATERTLDALGEPVPVTDRVESDGGLSTVRVGFARRLSGTLAVGASVGLYRGHVDRSFNREFNRELDTLEVVTPILPFAEAGKWTYSGPVASLSASWDPVPAVQVGTVLSWSGTLRSEPVGSTAGGTIKATPPLEVRLGATAILSSSLSVTTGLARADWSDLGNPLFDALSVGRTTTLGGGVQWRAGSVWAGDLPLRFGYRRSELPFLFRGEKATESVISGGFSVVMAQALDIPLATFDAAFEWGSRSAGGLDESFRRFTLTVRVGGR